LKKPKKLKRNLLVYSICEIIIVLITDIIIFSSFSDRIWLHGIVTLVFALSLLVFFVTVYSIDRQIQGLFNDFWDAIHKFAIQCSFQEGTLFPLTDAHERLIANVKKFRLAIWLSEFFSSLACVTTAYLGVHGIMLQSDDFTNFSSLDLSNTFAWLQLISFLIFLYYVWLSPLQIDAQQNGMADGSFSGYEDDSESRFDTETSSFFGVVRSMVNARSGLGRSRISSNRSGRSKNEN